MIYGTIPIVTIGLVLKKLIESSLTKDLYLIAGSLIVLALILGLAEKIAKFRKNLENISISDAVIIGFAQCLALIPGASRSGTTITAGLFLGLKRETAARFSFLLSVPAVLGSGLLEFAQSIKHLNGASTLTLIIATVVAGIVGYATIAFLLNFLKTKSTLVFIIYRIVLGAAILYMLVNHFIAAV